MAHGCKAEYSHLQFCGCYCHCGLIRLRPSADCGLNCELRTNCGLRTVRLVLVDLNRDFPIARYPTAVHPRGVDGGGVVSFPVHCIPSASPCCATSSFITTSSAACWIETPE